MYQIKIINKKEELCSCDSFSIRHFNWGGDYRPQAYGYAGLLKDKGFLIRLLCKEENPLCTYTKPNDPVYLDSALEAFLQLNSEKVSDYINLELNSNGTLLAKFGKDRSTRTDFTLRQIKNCPVESGRTDDTWWVEILLPFSIIEELYGPLSFSEGTKIRCNFYKISESKSCEHYASYAPIQHPQPNFHLPEFFADAVISK